MDTPSFLNQRFTRISLVLLTLQSLIFTQIPLLNYLGFEFSIATTPLLTLLSGLAVLRLASKAENVHKLPLFRALKFFARVSLFAIPPFVIAVGNALIVRNCAFPDGLLYYSIVVFPALAFIVTLALVCNAATTSFPRTFFVLAWGAVLSHVPIVTFAGSQIFAFNPIIGAFPGFTYDETLTILPKLALYRCSNLILIGFLLSLVGFLESRRQRPTAHIFANISFIAVCLWFLAVSTQLWQSDRLGFSGSLDHIRTSLGGIRETEHFSVIYPKETFTEAQAERLAELHEFYYDRIRKTLRVTPVRRITSVFYASPEQKSALVGGGRTDFAKPWLWQLHINAANAGQSLKHELTHILAAEFGFPLLRVGMNSGLIEGLAVAIERESNGEPLHRAAAQIVSTGIKSDLHDVFSTLGFFRTHSAVSYTLAGSFCRHLIEEFGVRRFKVLYRTGSFAEAYNRPLASLIPGWETRLRYVQLDRTDTVKALYFYKRPPIFTRECLRTIGNLNAGARRALSEQKPETALELSERSLALARTADAAFIRVQSLLRLRNYSLALTAIDSARSDDAMRSSLVPLDLYAGDAWWGLGDIARATDAYNMLLRNDLSAGWNEAASLRLIAIERFGTDAAVRNVILTPAADSVRKLIYDSLLSRNPNDVFKYMCARIADLDKESQRVIEFLRGLRDFPYDAVNYQAKRRLASAYVVRKEYERAKGALWESLNYATNDAEIMNVMESIERCEWTEKYQVSSR